MNARLLAAAALMLVVGCAAIQRPIAEPDAVNWDAHAASLSRIDSWQASGRLSATADGESVQGRFTWQQAPAWTEIRFRGPLGMGGWLVQGAPDQLLAVTGRGQEVLLHDPEPELQSLFGYPLPVRSMPRWMLGLADPDYEHDYQFGDHGLPVHLEQRGWELEYAEWRLYANHWLPRRIDMRRDDVALRVVLDDWAPTPDPG